MKLTSRFSWVQTAFTVGTTGAAIAAPADFPRSGNGLWYISPGTDWLDYLPIGNGYLAAMVPGGTAQETTQLNIESLWSGGPFADPSYNGQNKPPSDRETLATFVKKSRQDVFASPNGTISEYDAVLGATFDTYGSYAGAGYLLSTLNISGAVSDYARWLDLDNAIAQTQWKQGSSSFSRTSFCSHPSQACVEHITSSDALPGLTYSFSPYLESGLPTPNVTCLDDTTLRVRGLVADPGMLYEILATAKMSGSGTQASCTAVAGNDGQPNATLYVTGSSEAWITWVGGTNYDIDAGDEAHKFSFQGADPHDSLLSTLNAAVVTGAFSTALGQHVADYTAIVSRFSLDLGQKPGLDTPTDKLVDSYRADVGDPYLEWLLFNYGRYLLIGSARGKLPANLQGKWASDITNAWSADYHANINTQMNYWQAEMLNLPETTQSLFDFIEKTWAPRGAETAATLYNISRGWVTHNEMNIFGATGMKLGQDQWANYPESNVWMMIHLWDHFDFSPSNVTWWQSQGWPILKGVTQFHLDKLILDTHFNDSTLVVAPCNSPEQAPITFGCAHAQQLIWQLLNAADKGFTASGDTDIDFLNEVREKRAQIDSGIHIGSWGQLQEWKFEMDKENDTHRHLSHLIGLYPGYAIASFNRTIQPSSLPSGALTNYSATDVFAAAKTSLQHRGNGTGPDADSGWEKVWRAACWAQLGNADMFYHELSYALERNFYRNLFSIYTPDGLPFQIDANLGFPAALLNGLLQAPDTANFDEPLIVTLLPALPADKWPSGSITGARIRGGMTIDFAWSAGQPTNGTITVDGSDTLARDVLVVYAGKIVASFRTTTQGQVALAF